MAAIISIFNVIQNNRREELTNNIRLASQNANSKPDSAPGLTQQIIPITGTQIYTKFFSDSVFMSPSVLPHVKAPSLLSPSTSLVFGTQKTTEATKPVTKCEQPGRSSTTAFTATVFGKSVPVCEIHAKDSDTILFLVSQARGPDGNIYVSLALGTTGRDLRPFYGQLKQSFDSVRMNY